MAEAAIPGPPKNWLWVALLVTSFLTLWWSVSGYRSTARQVAQELASLQECRDLAAKIESWNRRPMVATLDVTSPQKLTQQITSCIKAAAIPEQSLLSISPGESSQINASDYRQRITSVRLRSVTLASLAKLQSALDKGDGIYLRDLRLTSTDSSRRSNASNEVEHWDALLTLTQLIYSPKSQ